MSTHDELKARLQGEKKLTAAEADAVLDRAAALQAEAEGPGHLSRDDLKAGAAEVGIDPRFVDEALARIERDREEALARSARARRTALVAAGVVLGLLVVLTLGARLSLGSKLDEVERRQVQLENVMERRRALLPELLALARAQAGAAAERASRLEELQRQAAEGDLAAQLASDEQIASELVTLTTELRGVEGADALLTRLADEMAGAHNRISVERKRYDEAALAYNQAARSFLWAVVRPLTGLPAEVPRSQLR